MTRAIVLISFILILSVNSAVSNPATQDSTRSIATQKITKVSDVKSFWAMAQYGGGIGYVIMGVLTVGLFLISFKGIELFMDQRSSRALRTAHFANMSFSEIERSVNAGNSISPQQASGNNHGKSSSINSISQNHENNSILGGAVNHMLSFYRTVGNASNMQQEFTTFIELQNEKFETFRNRLYFLSDSAGALGLLGTVWGVFLTFFGGDLDSEKILSGMAVALITTLLGLIVSLIINLFSTEIHGIFSRRLELVGKKADELRLRLLHFDTLSSQTSVAPAPGRFQKQATDAMLEKSQVEVVTQVRNFTLKLIDSYTSSLKAGEHINEAIRFQVIDQDGNPAPEHKIMLEAEGTVHFSDNQQKSIFFTDEQGEAVVDICGTKQTGAGEIYFWLEGEESGKQSLSVEVIPDTPFQIKIAGGNDQVGLVKNDVAEALKIIVSDRFGNPVSNTKVVFKLTMGEGKFKGGSDIFTCKTDMNGVAEAKFKLGEKAGFHTINVFIQDSDCKGAEFRILCKALNE